MPRVRYLKATGINPCAAIGLRDSLFTNGVPAKKYMVSAEQRAQIWAKLRSLFEFVAKQIPYDANFMRRPIPMAPPVYIPVRANIASPPDSTMNRDILIAKWQVGNDSLYGSYKERIVAQYIGECFKCGGHIDGQARERVRGSTTMWIHDACPADIVRRKKR